jgi:hypothetical protein
MVNLEQHHQTCPGVRQSIRFGPAWLSRPPTTLQELVPLTDHAAPNRPNLDGLAGQILPQVYR